MRENRELIELNHRAEQTLTADDVATVIEIRVSLLVMLTGALACIVCFNLFKALVQLWLHSQTS